MANLFVSACNPTKIPRNYGTFGDIWGHLGTFLCNFFATDMNWYLDTRSVGKDGRCPLRLRMKKGGRYAMILTGVRIAPDGWKDGRASDVRLNQRIRDMLDDAEDYELRLRSEGRYERMTVGELAGEIRRKILQVEAKRKAGDTLLSHMDAYRDRQLKKGTREIYSRTIKSLLAYDPDFAGRTFREVDLRYLRDFEAWALKRMKVNSVSILLRNVRTVFHAAQAEGATNCDPFARFKIRQEQTRKRCLTLEDLRRLASLPVPPAQEKYRDYFMLMFYLIGINTTDLFHAKPQDLENGRLHYRREKTGKLYSVKVEPEAQAIIDRYRGKDWLLEPLDRHGDFISWRNQLNKRLKALGQVTGKKGKILDKGPFPELSTYWSRHTWATLAYEVGVPVDIIGQALGHSDRSHAVTFIYIKPDSAKVDAANRKVLDYVKGPVPEGTEPGL